MRVLKTSGYCCDGCQWNFCDFYKEKKIILDDEFCITDTIFVCAMFNDIRIHSGSLNICNKVYGLSYDGAP